MLHKKLLESEVRSKLKGKIYNIGFVGHAHEDANEGTAHKLMRVCCFYSVHMLLFSIVIFPIGGASCLSSRSACLV